MKQRWFTLQHLLLAAATFLLVIFTTWITISGGIQPTALPQQSGQQALALVQGKIAGLLYHGMVTLPALVIFWSSALGLGWWVQDQWLPDHRARRVVRLGIGLGLMLLFTMLAGWVGLLNAWTAWFLCAPGVWIAAWKIADRKRRGLLDIERWPNPPWTMTFCLIPATFMLIAAICPPGTLWSVEAFGYDTLAYHLQLPKEWIASGSITPLPHNVYSHLPSLVESGYMQLLLMHGNMQGGIYACQIFHVTTALLAAAIVGQIVSRWTGPVPGGAASACFLLTPWTLIAGSSAYNEMVGLALVATALLLWLESDEHSRPQVALIGFALGCATLAKLTIGLMCVPMVACLMLLRIHETTASENSNAPTPKRQAGKVLVMLMAGLLVLLPWLVRNHLHTGNSVFPFATQLLGAGDWQPWQIEAWQRSSSLDDRWSQAPAKLIARLWLSPGYGAAGDMNSSASNPGGMDAFDITQFHRQGWLPLLWLGAVVGGIAAWQLKNTRRITLLMVLMLGGQLILWLAFTHQQARFLLPTLLPICVLIGLGCGRLLQVRQRIYRRLAHAGLIIFLVGLTWNQWDVLRHQTRLLRWEGGQANQPMYQIVDSLPTQPQPELMIGLGATVGDHVINYLPQGSKTLMIADATVLYVQTPVIYNSAFDRSLLGDGLRLVGPAPAPVNAYLKQNGISHVWVHWAELQRLQATYGYDPQVTESEIRRLAENWRLVSDYGWASLYALP